MKQFFLTTFLVALLTGASQAQSKQVREAAFGVAFEVPEGWQYQKTDYGYVLGSNTMAGIMLLMASPYKTLEEMRQAAYQGIQEEGGTMLNLSGNISNFGTNGIAGYFQGTMSWEPAKAYSIGLASNKGGKGVTCMVVTTPQQFSDKHVEELEKLVRSFQFFEPEIPAEVKEWEKWFKTPGGCRLKYLTSSGSSDYSGGYTGSSSEATIDLCPNGNFAFSSSSDFSMSIDAGSAFSASNDGGQGTWEVGFNGRLPVLILHFRNGNESEYELTYVDEKTYLNGSRYFVLFEKDGPQCY